MNLSLIVGLVLASLTIWFGVFQSVKDPKFYLDSHALILVLGGTLAATFIGFPLSRVWELFGTLKRWFLRSKTPDYRIVEELYEVALYYRKYKDLLSSVEFSHPFIREGFEFVKSQKFNEKQVQEILLKRIMGFKKQMQEDAKMLSAMAKYPPAFGLLGASTGMIAMMLNLNQGGSKSVGPALAIALVATFWGIALANLVLLPLADFANKVAQEDSHTRLLIMEGLLLVKRNEDPLVIVEQLKSYLHPSERSKVKVLRGLDLSDRGAA
jgi:chemotaxis protein MotA